MSQEQRLALDGLLRGGPLDLAGDLAQQRAILEQMLTSQPLSDDVDSRPRELGGIPAIEISIAGVETTRTVLYLHGGAYVMGSAASSVGLASEIARRSRARVITLDYRLAPENPYPAAIDDALAAYRALLDEVDVSEIAFAGESAGGGLVLATLIAARDAGLPMPASAAVFSPFADLTLSGESITSRQAIDPALTVDGLRLRGGEYAAGSDPTSPTLSPVFADFTGLPPLLVQVGSHEILLDDALRVAERAARDDVEVQLQVTPGVPHVFQGFVGMLDEADTALDDAARFLVGRFPR
jgi:monoterpene epsilon-lactone hydrolase